MTVVPLPDVPCLRVRLIYTNGDTSEAGSRFYLSYGGSAPTPGNCQSIASDIAAAWATHLAPLPSDDWSLTEVDVLDIATDSGSSGQWTGSNPASGGTVTIGSNQCMNVEYNIARRYRGGKPRMFIPGGNQTNLLNGGHWTTGWVTTVTAAVTAFFGELAGISVGAVGTLAHVNLSYYKGFHNITNSSGRERAVPTYRDVALHDNVESYAAKQLIGSQRRRRAATTP